VAPTTSRRPRASARKSKTRATGNVSRRAHDGFKWMLSCKPLRRCNVTYLPSEYSGNLVVGGHYSVNWLAGSWTAAYKYSCNTHWWDIEYRSEKPGLRSEDIICSLSVRIPSPCTYSTTVVVFVRSGDTLHQHLPPYIPTSRVVSRFFSRIQLGEGDKARGITIFSSRHFFFFNFFLPFNPSKPNGVT